MVLGIANGDGANALDQQQTLDFNRGWQVVSAASGSNLVTAGTGSYEVDIASGSINTPSGTVACSAATLDLQSLVDPDLPRIVVVYRDASGTAQSLAGNPAPKEPSGETTPAALYQPAPDAFTTTDGVVVATVLLEAGASAVTSGQIRDRRLPAEQGNLIANSADFESVSTDNASIGWPAGATAVKTSDQSLSGGSIQRVTWDDTDGDGGQNWDLSNNEYIVPSDGTYRVEAALNVGSMSTGEVNPIIRVNGSNVLDEDNEFSTQPFNTWSFDFGQTINGLSEGDAISIEFFSTNSANIIGTALRSRCAISKTA